MDIEHNVIILIMALGHFGQKWTWSQSDRYNMHKHWLHTFHQLTSSQCGMILLNWTS